MTPEERAHAVIETEAAYEMRGLGGADALEGKVAQAIRETFEECAQIADAAMRERQHKTIGWEDWFMAQRIAAAIRARITAPKESGS